MRPGFPRAKLESRYNVSSLTEDDWHSYTGEVTQRILSAKLAEYGTGSKWVLNAGSGIYTLGSSATEVCVDLFPKPLGPHDRSVCATVESLPFSESTFDIIVCVGEVLAYCDPAIAIAEFARVARNSSLLVLDFGNSRSPRYWLRNPYGRAADLVTDQYNGTAEEIWIYNPQYIRSLVSSFGYDVRQVVGIHTISALARRLGASPRSSVRLQRLCDWIPLPESWSDVTTIVAARSAS